MRSFSIPLMTTAVFMVALMTASGYAQDRPADVPEGLPTAVSGPLAIRKESLLQRLDGIKVKIAAHNQKCGAVRRGSAQDMKCLQDLTVLQKEVGAYSHDVRDFNKTLMQAISSSPDQTVPEDKRGNAPASKEAAETSQTERKAE